MEEEANRAPNRSPRRVKKTDVSEASPNVSGPAEGRFFVVFWAAVTLTLLCFLGSFICKYLWAEAMNKITEQAVLSQDTPQRLEIVKAQWQPLNSLGDELISFFKLGFGSIIGLLGGRAIK